jgi:cytochrome bd ubiquinol oxidase subunit II
VSGAVAVVLFFGVTAYALFGGADFGSGFWDLTAGGTDRGKRPRAVVGHSIGPVWEANHVWLIFILVVMWTAFSDAFASIYLTLFVPLSLAALGIVMRGASFAFRKEVSRVSSQRNFGAAFALSSVLVPFCFGAVAGAIASGRVPAGGVAGDPWSSWLNPTSILGGVLAVVACAYLAAVYLVWDAARVAGPDMVEYFRRRAMIAGVVAGVVALAGIFVLRDDAEYLYDNLITGRALPLVIVSALCGIGSLVLLYRQHHRGARLLAMGAVVAVIWGWGVAQWPYLLPETLKVSDGAAPDATLWTVLIVFGIAAVTILPSLGLLYYLDQRSLLASDEQTSTSAIS